MSKILLGIGCEVLLAEDGGQAIKMVRLHRPDIIFMDIRMPVMNGLEAAQQIWGELWEWSPDHDNREREFPPTEKVAWRSPLLP